MLATRPDVLLGLTVLRPEERRIAAALESRGLKVQIHADRDGFSQLNPKVIGPKVALIRSMSHKTAENGATLLELGDVRTINSSQAIHICANKSLQALHFAKHGIPQPEFNIAFKVSDVKEMGESFGGDYVVKPVDASWGRGIARLTSQDCFESWSAGRESVDPNEKAFPLLVQKYVRKGNFDMRVVLVGNEPVVAFKRVSDHWKTNTHLGARVEPMEITDGIREISHQVIQLLGPGIYGLDLFQEDGTGRLLVCEVNQNPEFDKSSKIHGVDVADHIAAFVKGVL
jgi:[lysine-biosynthesis-protein LysW]--L-2-aminoadipate ligase